MSGHISGNEGVSSSDDHGNDGTNADIHRHNNEAAIDEFEANKKAAMAGQWRTPPMPAYPSGFTTISQQQQQQQQQQHYRPQQHLLPPSHQAAQPQQHPGPPQQSVSDPNMAGDMMALQAPTTLPDNSEDYAKALQEAYRKGAEAAARMAQQNSQLQLSSHPQPQQQPQQQPPPPQPISNAASCPNFSTGHHLAPGPPPATSMGAALEESAYHHQIHPSAQQHHQQHQHSIGVPDPLSSSMPPPPPPPPPPHTQHHAPPPSTYAPQAPPAQHHYQHHPHHAPPPQTHVQYAPAPAPPTYSLQQQHHHHQYHPNSQPSSATAMSHAPPAPLSAPPEYHHQQQQHQAHADASQPGALPLPHQQPQQQQQQMQVAAVAPAVPKPPAGRSLSMPDMSAYAAKAEEEKRQKRLARNRASARQRRLRKKNLVDAYETEVGILETTLKKLHAHEWGRDDDHKALLDALGMERGQQAIGPEQRTEIVQDILRQQMKQVELLRQAQMEQECLVLVANMGGGDGDGADDELARELQDILQLSEAQKADLRESSRGLDQEVEALETVAASLVAMQENDWLLNEGVQKITDQFTSILHKNQLSKLLLWTDANAEAIDQLDHVQVQPLQSAPVFTFGVESAPLDDE